MFKSKILRYGAIAVTTTAAIAVISSIILSQNSSLQSQDQTVPQPLIKSPAPEASQNLEQLAGISDADMLAQQPDQSEKDTLPSGRMLKNLNLSPSQLQKLKEIRDRDRDKIRNLSQQVRQSSKELRDLLGSEASVDVIRSKHNQVQDQQRQVRNLHFERMLAMREVLTPQQRSQLQEILQKSRPNRIKEGMKDRSQNRLDGRPDGRLDRRRNREELPLL